MISEIENKILELLAIFAEKPLPEGLGYKFKTFESYPDNWEAYFNSTTKVIEFPAAWVTFGGATTIAATSFSTTFDARFGLMLAAKNLRNQGDARGGDLTGKVGVYQMVEDAIALLNGNDLHLDISALEVLSVQFVKMEALRKRGVVAMAIQLKTEITIEVKNQDPNALGDFNTMFNSWAPQQSEHLINQNIELNGDDS